MSKAAIRDPQEFRRPPAARLRRCVRGVAIRLGIVSVALVAGIFPVAARSLQIQSFHPLYPTRPAAAHAPSLIAPAATKPASALAKGKGKLTPKERQRMAKAMNRRMPNRKAPQAHKSVR
jgi:hypothetical protein